MVLMIKQAWPAIIFLSTFSLVSFAGELTNRKCRILQQTEQEHTQTPTPQGPSPSEPNSDADTEEDGLTSNTAP